ncbi:MAG: hypothetical protein KDD94_05805 [Calditrichaeota bacterium]|nr:hypothetical protein [Calditrichota bacterium]
MQYKIKQIGGNRAGLVSATTMLIFGVVVFLLIYLPVSYILPGDENSTIVYDPEVFLIVPVLYTLLAYVSGALYAFVYNICASKFFALEVTLEQLDK